MEPCVRLRPAHLREGEPVLPTTVLLRHNPYQGLTKKEAVLPLRKRYMTASSEIRLASGLLAALAIITSQFLFAPPASIDEIMVLISDGAQNYLAWAMMAHGVVIFMGLGLKCRPLRQWGLVIGGISWVALGAVLLSVWATLMTVLLVTIVGLFYVGLLVLDVQKKPRCNP